MKNKILLSCLFLIVNVFAVNAYDIIREQVGTIYNVEGATLINGTWIWDGSTSPLIIHANASRVVTYWTDGGQGNMLFYPGGDKASYQMLSDKSTYHVWHTILPDQLTTSGVKCSFSIYQCANCQYYRYIPAVTVAKASAYYTITAKPNNASYGKVNGGGQYMVNTTTTLSATSNIGFYFVKWNDGNTSNPRTITVSANATYTAEFAPNQRDTIFFDAMGGIIPTIGNMAKDFGDIHATYLSKDQHMGYVETTRDSSYFALMPGDCPVRKGYTFLGWYTTATGGEQVYNAAGEAIAGKYWNKSKRWIGTSNLNVYAQWIPLLPGLFSINDSAMIRFSSGNLQYQAVPSEHHCADGTLQKGLWRFAEHQYDYIGENNINASATYNGWIDLFDWGTSGWSGSGANIYQPWDGSGTYSDHYLNGDCNQSAVGAYRYADWGIYNAITNGGCKPDQWRLLTNEEKNYIFLTRPNASALFGRATVNGVQGLIILPDSWETPIGISFIPTQKDATTNIYTLYQWNIMEQLGAVFLPASGQMGHPSAGGNKMFYVHSSGWYWTSTSCDINSVWGWSMDIINHDLVRGYALAVRLVQDVNVHYLTVLSCNEKYGTVSGSGRYEDSTTVVITATPKECCRFVKWSDGNTYNPRNLTITQDSTLTAIFEPISPDTLIFHQDSTLRDTIYTSITGVENNHEWIDMGLPSGTRWASCNVGASQAEEYGEYYAWGETIIKADYAWSTYKYCNGTNTSLTKYCTRGEYGTIDNITNLLPEDDAASQLWSGNWRTPTKYEWQELLETQYCSWSREQNNGINGYRIQSKINFNSIFLPATGYKDNMFPNDWLNIDGHYWTSTLSDYEPDRSTYIVMRQDSGFFFSREFRRVGTSIRPVCSNSATLYIYSNDCNKPTKYITSKGCSVLVTAIPIDSCYQFVKWSDNDTSNPRNLTVTQDSTLTAIFEKIQFNVSINTSDSIKGKVKME